MPAPAARTLTLWPVLPAADPEDGCRAVQPHNGRDEHALVADTHGHTTAAAAQSAGVLPSTDERREFVWAVDPAVGRQAFAFAPLDGGPIVVETVVCDSEAREGQRLGLLDRRVRSYAAAAARRYPPAVVWVEQPSGRHRNLPLAYAVGVVQAAVHEALAVPVWTIPSATWKQRTVGAGNASKAQVAAWVAERGADVNGQDEADAYAIAAAGRAMVVARRWEAVA